MKKIKIQLISLILLFPLIFGCFVGCGRDDDKKINKGKTQLYFSNYAAGFGGEWLDELKPKFEELYKDTVFEEGKKGVELWVDDGFPEVTDLPNSRDSLAILENRDYYNYISHNAIADISEIMTKPLTEYGEEKSIEQKLLAYNPNATDYYKTSDNKFYGVPLHEGFWCINYDIEVFESYKLYFSASSDEGKIGWTDTGAKSKGPDGLADTYDDGLPATYDDFYLLLDRMKDAGVIPFAWSGLYIVYTTLAMSNWWADAVGSEQTALNVKLNGKAKDLVVFDENGDAKRDANGDIITETLDINENNGYELTRQLGKYQALELAKKIVSDTTNYTRYAFSNSETHKSAQSTYINSAKNGSPIAFLIDGNYWMREATDAFNSMVISGGEEFSKENRKFGVLPMPKPTKSKIGEPPVFLGGLTSMIVMNANVKNDPVKLDLATKFLRFLHTEDSIKTFTEFTGCTRPYEYNFSQEEIDKLPTYTRSMWNMHTYGDILNPLATNKYCINRYKDFVLRRTSLSTIIDKVGYTDPFSVFHDRGYSVDAYFNGMYTYQKNIYSSING